MTTAETLANKLALPMLAVDCLAQLEPEQLDDLAQRIDAAVALHGEALDEGLKQALPWPVRGPLLRWLRR